MSPARRGPYRLVLLRHAPAEHRNPRRWRDDDRRPLRSDGRRSFAKAAKGLAGLLTVRGDVAVSPLLRAAQTAELLAGAWAPAKRHEVYEELRPDASCRQLLERAAARARPRVDLVLVGHEPQISRFVGLATVGEAIPLIEASKGGAIALVFDAALVPGGGRIEWALTRGQLGRLGRRRGAAARERG